MSDHLVKNYDIAVGLLLNAALDLRRFDSLEAVDRLKSAIRIIEDARRKADIEDRRRAIRPSPIEPLPAPTIESLEVLLNSEDDRPVKINPDGTVSVL